MPAIEEPGSRAIGFTVSFAPITRVTSVSEKSSLISSISKTTYRNNFFSIGNIGIYMGWEKVHTVVRYGSLSKEDVTLPRHSSSNWVDCEPDVYTLCSQHSSDI